MTLAKSRLLELPILASPGRDNWIEVVYNGKNYRTQLGPVANLAQFPAPGLNSKYWIATPAYSVEEDRSVDILSEARIFYNAQENLIAAVNNIGSLPALQVETNQRFDALCFDTVNGVYVAFIGAEVEENPATPTFNNDRYLLLSYLFNSGEEVTINEPPQSHTQNTDQYLDKGGPYQIHAGTVKIGYELARHIAGDYQGVENLPGPIVQKTMLAFVGTTKKEIYIYNKFTDAWEKFSSGAGGGGPAELPFVFFSELDTVSARRIYAGPRTVSNLVISSELSAVTFEVRLDTASSWSSAADITALQAWINSNVNTSSVKWLIRGLATYAAGKTGEANASIQIAIPS